MGRMMAWSVVFVTAGIVGPGIARAQRDPCEGRGTLPDGSCRTAAPIPDRPPAPTGIEIVSEPDKAEVRGEDGAYLGQTPLKVDVTRLGLGQHHLSIRRNAYEDATLTVTVARGKFPRVSIVLIRLPLLTLLPIDDEAKGGIVSVDGRAIGTVPVPEYPVQPGKHTLRVEKEDHVPWEQEVKLLSGSRPPPIEVALKPQMGTLTVAGSLTAAGSASGAGSLTGTGSLTGAKVYLDPDNPSNPASGELLGLEPLQKTVKAGKHRLVIAPEDLPPIVMQVRVVANDNTVVPAQLPALNAPEEHDSIPIDMEKAQRACDEDPDRERKGEACVVLGHIAMHPAAANEPPNRAEAERRYRQGCDAGNTMACFALGYLAPKHTGGGWLLQACRAKPPITNACWARYAAAITDIPDPTLASGDRSQFEPDPKLSLELKNGDGFITTAVGVGPFEGSPFYAETEAAVGFAITRKLYFDFHGGLRFRLYWQRDVLSDTTSAQFEGGLGYELGLMFRPFAGSSFAVRTDARGSAYFPSHLSYGATLAASYRSGERQFEIGLAFDRVPLRSQQVMAFGEMQTVDQQRWSPVVLLSYGFFIGR